jgi:hypothetical protein
MGRWMLSGRVLAVVSFSVCVAGCGGSTPQPQPSASEERVQVERALGFVDRGWGLVESQKRLVAVPLPERTAWRVDDGPLWLSATHVGSKSILMVRTWRSGSVVAHEGCEAEARTFRPDLFGKDPSALVDRRPLGAPAGYDTEVAFQVKRAANALAGIAVAVGAKVRDCMVLAYATRADGPDAATAVSHRLAFVAERVFPQVFLRKAEDRVERAPR